MKAMILAAGRGKRMMPLTADMPKPMLEVAGLPLLAYHIARCKAVGITEIVINLAWQGDKIRDYFQDGSKFGVQIEYSQEPIAGLETAGGILAALPLLCSESESQFVVINGDIFTDYQLDSLLQLHLAAGEGHLVLVENPPQHPAGDFTLCHQPLNPTRYTFSGIARYDRAFFDGITPGFVALGPILRERIAAGRVSTELYLGQWHDVGTPERLAELNAQQGDVHVG